METKQGQRPARARRGLFWPAFLVTMLGSLIAGLGYMVYRAVGDRSFGVERNYYQKSLAWDAHMAQEAHNRALGWRLVAQEKRGDTPAEAGRLEVTLTDRDGRPLPGARVSLEAFHLARSGDIHTISLTALGEGRYDVPMPLSRLGLWELRFVAEAGGEQFTNRQRIDVGAKP